VAAQCDEPLGSRSRDRRSPWASPAWCRQAVTSTEVLSVRAALHVLRRLALTDGSSSCARLTQSPDASLGCHGHQAARTGAPIHAFVEKHGVRQIEVRRGR